MADKYDKNGYNSSDFKRNSCQDMSMQEHDPEQDGEENKMNEKAGEYMRELLSEKIKLNSAKFPASIRLLDSEIAKLQSTGRIPPKEFKYVDVYREKPSKVSVKVLVPIKEHPKVNFVGKLLGQKGQTLKSLQDDTMCKMAILGRGSIRDRQKEEELRNSLDPKYAHLSDELHIEISALAPPAEAHARIAYALAEIKKYLIPDMDPPQMMQRPPMREIMERDEMPSMAVKNTNVVYSACTVTKRSFSYQNPTFGKTGAPPPPPHVRPAAPRPPPAPMRPMPAKNKVFSILERARNAMETSYSYEDPYAAPEPPVPRGPHRAPAPEPDYYYERNAERYYDDEGGYYKDEPREYKATARDVGTRRPPAARHYARAAPYTRAPK